MTLTGSWPVRVVAGHRRTWSAVLVGVVVFALQPDTLAPWTRGIVAWDVGGVLLLSLAAVRFAREGSGATMAENARQQSDGEWTMFCVTLAGVLFSFVALTTELANVKELSPFERSLHVSLVGGTLLLSWLVTHVVFAVRYSHEYYTTSLGRAEVDGGLQFPGEDAPDYWDFVYFALVLGMTFQVSDVEITSRKLRRLASVHGLIGFLFNTVIVALTVNIAAGLIN